MPVTRPYQTAHAAKPGAQRLRGRPVSSERALTAGCRGCMQVVRGDPGLPLCELKLGTPR